MILLHDALVPFLKWAGGKRQSVEIIKKYVDQFENYYEPFVGGGALLFSLQPQQASIADINEELINCYLVVRDSVEELIKSCQGLQSRHSHNFYYWIRDLSRSHDFKNLSPIVRAARFIYLNKSCYNGLFRVNKKGEFNVPIGKSKQLTVVNPVALRQVSAYLQTVDIECADFAETLEMPQRGDLIYCDPPYHPLNPTSFVGYTCSGFGEEEQLRLKICLDAAVDRGCQVICSNSNHTFIRHLYEDKRYKLIEINSTRRINSVSTGRGEIRELLIVSN